MRQQNTKTYDREEVVDLLEKMLKKHWTKSSISTAIGVEWLSIDNWCRGKAVRHPTMVFKALTYIYENEERPSRRRIPV
ncbi:hypothetical protein CL653_02040 [bacterium]|nr:hypothetical protein [bacterium]|tara:strand:+ start:520 stop:756 length:237 start_codon:yes stop_codon:yes gene_type:complete